MAGNPPCQVHEDRAAVFTGTFFDSGQSIVVCGECLIDFCSVIANPPVGEAALDEGGEVTTPGEGDSTEGPTPDGEQPSSGSPESSPDDTTHEGDEELTDEQVRAIIDGFETDAPVNDTASTPSN